MIYDVVSTDNPDKKIQIRVNNDFREPLKRVELTILDKSNIFMIERKHIDLSYSDLERLRDFLDEILDY